MFRKIRLVDVVFSTIFAILLIAAITSGDTRAGTSAEIAAEITATPFPVSITITEQELFTQMKAEIAANPQNINFVLVDFTPGQINATGRLINGTVGNVVISIVDAGEFAVIHVESITINGSPAPDGFVNIVHEELMTLLIESLNTLIEANVGAGHDLIDIAVTDTLIEAVFLAAPPDTPTPTAVPTDIATATPANPYETFDFSSVPGIWAGATCNNVCGDGSTTSNAALAISVSTGEFLSPQELFYSNGDMQFSSSVATSSALWGNISASCEVGIVGGDVTINGTVTEGYSPPPTGPALPFTIEDFAPGGYYAWEVVNDPFYGLYYAITSDTVAANLEIPPYSWYDTVNHVWEPQGDIEGLYYVEGEVVIGVNASFGDIDGDGDWRGITIAATDRIDFSGGSDKSNVDYYVGGVLFFSDFHPPEPLACNAASHGISISSYTTSDFMGVVFAPHSGISFVGADTSYIGALVGQFVDFSASYTYFEYAPEMMP